MQKIMILAKLWSDHAEGLKSGLRARELDVREQELLWSQTHTDDENGTDFLGSNFQLGTYANSAALRTALLQWCCSSRTFGANPTVSAGNGKGSAEANTKIRKEVGRTMQATRASNTDMNTCKKCGRTGHWAKDCWRPSGEADDNSTKGKNHKKRKGKSKHVDVVETNQSSDTA